MANSKNILETLKKIKALMQNTSTFNRHLNDFKIVSARRGSMIAELKVDEQHLNHMGNLHSALLVYIVDIMTGMSEKTLEEQSTMGVSVDMHLTYFKPCKLGDEIVIETSIVDKQQQLAFLNCIIRNKKDDSIVITGSHLKYIGGPYQNSTRPILDIVKEAMEAERKRKEIL